MHADVGYFSILIEVFVYEDVTEGIFHAKQSDDFFNGKPYLTLRGYNFLFRRHYYDRLSCEELSEIVHIIIFNCSCLLTDPELQHISLSSLGFAKLFH